MHLETHSSSNRTHKQKRTRPSLARVLAISLQHRQPPGLGGLLDGVIVSYHYGPLAVGDARAPLLLLRPPAHAPHATGIPLREPALTDVTQLRSAHTRFRIAVQVLGHGGGLLGLQPARARRAHGGLARPDHARRLENLRPAAAPPHPHGIVVSPLHRRADRLELPAHLARDVRSARLILQASARALVARQQPAGGHQALLAAVAPATPHDGCALPDRCGCQRLEPPKALTRQILHASLSFFRHSILRCSASLYVHFPCRIIDPLQPSGVRHVKWSCIPPWAAPADTYGVQSNRLPPTDSIYQ